LASLILIIGDEMIYTKTARIKFTEQEARDFRFHITQGFDAHFYNWNRYKDECTVSLVCSDSLPNPLRCFTKEDLEVELIKKFGARIIKENLRLLPRHLGQQHMRIGTPTGSPLLRRMPLSHRDNFEETYPKLLTKPEIQEMNASFIAMSQNPKLKWLRDKRVKVDKITDKGSIVEMAMLR
jgi:hypothetical protein